MPRARWLQARAAVCLICGLCVHSTNEGRDVSVAVVGGGSAGAITILELLSRPNISVTLFEQGPTIGHAKSASGIIAALLVFNAGEQYWHKIDDVNDVLEKRDWMGFAGNGTDHTRLLKFAELGLWYRLARKFQTKKENQIRFFHASRKHLETMLDLWPQLCKAIVGPFCCREGSNASSYMDEHADDVGWSCSHKRGVAHVFTTHDDFDVAAHEDKAEAGGWLIYGKPSEDLMRLNKYLNSTLSGAVWNDKDEGFVRVEDLFPILMEIFEESGRVTVATGCLVTELRPRSEENYGQLEVITAEGCDQPREFDRVIVASGANSAPLMRHIDGMVMSQLVPVKGFAAASDKRLVATEDEGIGVEFEEKGQYIRAQRNGGVRYGFGRVFGTFDDELLDPSWGGWHPGTGPNETGLGARVLGDPDHSELTGLRPVSCWGNFPLIKRYEKPYEGLVLNTGFGFHGYGMTWMSAKIAADAALEDEGVELLDDLGRATVVVSTGQCGWWIPVCFPVWMHAVTATFLIVGLVFVLVRVSPRKLVSDLDTNPDMSGPDSQEGEEDDTLLREADGALNKVTELLKKSGSRQDVEELEKFKRQCLYGNLTEVRTFVGSWAKTGLANFLVVPIGIFFGRSLQVGAFFVVCLVKFILTICVQGHMLELLRNWSMSLRNPRAIRETHKDNTFKTYHSAPLMWMTVIFRGCVELFDTDLDAINAGQANVLVKYINAADEERSWKYVPLLGHIAALGLDNVLIVVVMCAASAQAAAFLWCRRQALQTLNQLEKLEEMSEEKSVAWCEFWRYIAVGSGVSGLMAIERVAAELASSKGDAYAQISVFYFKVAIESMPSLLFAVNMLALTVEMAQFRSLTIMLLSAVCSWMNILTGIGAQFANRQDVRAKLTTWQLAGHMFVLCVASSIVVVSGIRWWGVFYCPSHIACLDFHCVVFSEEQ